MDFTSVLKNELFRPLVTMIIPGAVASAPFIQLVHYHIQPTKLFAQESPYAYGFVVLIVIVSVGLVLEDIGSRLEKLWDKCLSLRYPNRVGQWKEYLKLKTQDEYICQRYLRTIMVRFKFELSMGFALIIFTIGLIALNSVYHFWTLSTLAWFSTFLFASGLYLLFESFASADQLWELHEYMLEAVRNKS